MSNLTQYAEELCDQMLLGFTPVADHDLRIPQDSLVVRCTDPTYQDTLVSLRISEDAVVITGHPSRDVHDPAYARAGYTTRVALEGEPADVSNVLYVFNRVFIPQFIIEETTWGVVVEYGFTGDQAVAHVDYLGRLAEACGRRFSSVLDSAGVRVTNLAEITFMTSPRVAHSGLLCVRSDQVDIYRIKELARMASLDDTMITDGEPFSHVERSGVTMIVEPFNDDSYTASVIFLWKSVQDADIIDAVRLFS